MVCFGKLFNNSFKYEAKINFFTFFSINGNDRFSIRSSVENGSVTLKTESIHCTASMGNSSHLFIRYNDRRVHFDGSNFVVRNMGHSASFDSQNNLRIH